MSDFGEVDPRLSENLQREVKRFHREGDGYVDTFAVELNKAEVPQTVYHYTDGAGLRGILESGMLRFGDIFYLNDPSELRYGVELACKILHELTAQHDHPLYRKFSQRFEQGLTSGVEEVAHFFVCCFSKSGNDLGQWRTYADNGKGYALGFDGPSLERAFSTDPDANGQTFSVTYEEERLAEIHRHVMASATKALSFLFGSGVKGDEVAPYLRELHQRLSFLTLQSALLFKHDAYAHEQEYRFLQIHQAGPVSGVKFRDKPYALPRYREFNWKKVAPDALKVIMIGPGAVEDTARRFANDCCRAFHKPLDNDAIIKSRIPYKAV